MNLDTSAVNLDSSETSEYIRDYKNGKGIQESTTLTPNLDTSKHSRQDKMAFCQRYLHLGGVAGVVILHIFRRIRLLKRNVHPNIFEATIQSHSSRSNPEFTGKAPGDLAVINYF